ncbi:cytidine deaminase [Legionella moravica]|uniref:Cytidine deaminase n=1 Tax=Legionella moravica TaxID=39962 RepID=A0A378JZG1_9GAMM|nr:cytidine deaminase [Legionella moravica]KTD34252.1 cytidine deaminase [Legionella moravica]STX62872.1 cytidine deaminase [Legionella moravica]
MDKLISRMINNAHEALKHAYAPYSNFNVGCCICTPDDNLYTGVNVENSSYGLTVCAEGSAICQMVTAGERKIKSIVVLASNNLLCPPCGACRQRIYEFSIPDTMIYLCNNNSVLQKLTMNELMPLAFDIKP